MNDRRCIGCWGLALACAVMAPDALSVEGCRAGSIPVPAALEMTALGEQREASDRFHVVRGDLRAGRHEAARDALRIILQDAKLSDADRASGFSLVALAHAGAGDFAAARDAGRRALAFEGLAPGDAAPVGLNTGVAFANVGDDEAALNALGRAADLSAKAGLPDIRARALANVAALSARVPGADSAKAAGAALEAARVLPAPATRAALLVTVGDALVAGESKETVAYDVLRAAYESASLARNAAQAAQALGLIASLQLTSGARQQSLQTLGRAIELSRAAADDAWGFRWQWMAGRVQRALGDHVAARNAFAKAVERLEDSKSRHALGAPRGSRAWREVYIDLADAHLREATQLEAAPRQAALVAARNALELSRAAEVEDFFNDPCIASRTTRRASPEEVDGKVAVIYPVALDDRLEIIVGHRSGLKQFTSSRSSRELAASVSQLRALLEKRTTRQYLRAAQQLHQALIGPLESHLATLGVDTLVIVPDGPFRTVPFAVLHDGKRFLIERYALAITPVASLTEPRALAPSGIRALLSGLTEARQGFPALPAVDAELESVGSVLGAPVYRNEAFSSAALESALSKAPINVLHVASHGQFSRDPSETFVLTFDGHLTLSQLRHAIAAGKLREEPLELLTLSACQTATGDERAALGLAGVALGAGARSALASLWAVNDESTSLLITAFYENLARKGLTKAASLRLAQLDLARDERFAHPAYWAPFLIIGNWL
jgi:CHAT domain-containing protein